MGGLRENYFLCITKTCLYNFDSHKPHFYIVKLEFTGVYIIFLILLKNTDCGYSFAKKHRLWVLVRTASPRRFQRVPTIYVLSRNMKNIRFFFLSENFPFLVVTFSIHLNRRDFVMEGKSHPERKQGSIYFQVAFIALNKEQGNRYHPHLARGPHVVPIGSCSLIYQVANAL